MFKISDKDLEEIIHIIVNEAYACKAIAKRLEKLAEEIGRLRPELLSRLKENGEKEVSENGKST